MFFSRCKCDSNGKATPQLKCFNMTCPEPRKIEAGTEETDSACPNLAFAKSNMYIYLTMNQVYCFIINLQYRLFHVSTLQL